MNMHKGREDFNECPSPLCFHRAFSVQDCTQDDGRNIYYKDTVSIGKDGNTNMVLEPKSTTVAYRCPHCGVGVISVIGMMDLGADMLKLKCECGKSELVVSFTKDGLVRLSVPCILCPKPHTFTVRRSLFLEKEMFAIPCPYSDINVCMIGETNQVNGIESFDAFHREEEQEELPDPEIRDIVVFVIRELDAEGKIFCRCPAREEGEEGNYDIEFAADHLRITCRDCGASKTSSTDSYLAAHAFLNTDELRLE